MGKRGLTQAQRDYQEFDVHRRMIVKTLTVFLGAILVGLVSGFRVLDETPIPLLLFLSALIVYTIITILICRHLMHKHRELYGAAYGNDTDIIHTGLFGELCQEFEWNQYEGLTDGKVVFAEIHNNTIDLQIIRKKHEFLVEITQDRLGMICDEETDQPIEKEIPLSSFKNVGGVFLAIRRFIESNS